jgi:hypothetical protein
MGEAPDDDGLYRQDAKDAKEGVTSEPVDYLILKSPSAVLGDLGVLAVKAVP